MPFEPGNKLSVKAKVFDQALRRAIASDDGARVRKAADTLLNLAAEGEAWALRELIDRLDGKAVQIAEISVSDSRPDELTDAQLLDIASRGGSRTTETSPSTKVPSSVH